MTRIQGINAIFAGDYPDPSIVRVGQDYYMTHSSFHYTPGLLIWHSRNLIDWKPIAHAITEHVGGSIMAPDLIYYEGLFYIYFPAGSSNWVVTAENPAGPWSKPIDLKIGYIDPGHAVDQAGNRFLFLSDGHQIGLSRDGLSTTGELKKVYDGWRYPKQWLTEGFYLESPKLTFKDGYYYMTSAQGGTAGPATSHMIVSARSKSLEGPWENSPFNPIVRTVHRNEKWWSKGHGTLVDSPEEDWFVVYHAYEKDYYTLGRQTLIEPIQWTIDGWFKTVDAQAPADCEYSANGQLSQASEASHVSEASQASEVSHVSQASEVSQISKISHVSEVSLGSYGNMELTAGGRLGPHWHFFGGERLTDYSIEDHQLLLNTASNKAEGPLLSIPVHHAYTVDVSVAVAGEAQGTLGLFYKPGFHCGIGFDGKQAFAFRDQYRSEHVEVSSESAALRIVNDHHEVSLYFRGVNGQWNKLDHGFEMSGFHHNVLGDFLSLRIALNATGEGRVRFSEFAYRAGVFKA